MIAVCPICGTDVDTQGRDTVHIELAMARDLGRARHPTQEFYCHLQCIKRVMSAVSIDLASDNSDEVAEGNRL
jgi:hypothetical protein